ncbi:hypothetical protein [Flavobacterium sp.]|uniref:hypothetical protein n=1 Tax=Flavobacterium sp. TaxID=239 RepID=UPI003BD9A889
MKTKIYILIILSINNLTFSQIRKIIIVDESNSEKINEVKILSNSGVVIANTNANGEINLDISFLKKENVSEIETSHFLYETKKLNLNKLLDTIKLETKFNLLNEVVIKRRKEDKYYKTKAYFRSWRLSNNKLQNYAEGIKEVYIPFESSKSNKEYFVQYISYKDTLFSKNYIDISFGGDGYLFTKIYSEDYYNRYKKLYTLKKKTENQSDMLEDNSNVGYINYDENGQIIEINKKDVAENIKILGKTLNYKNYTYEKWKNTENRHLSMSRNTIIKDIKSKNKSLIIETVTEIYIEDEEYFSDEKPTKYKNIVNPDKSFYNTSFYDIYRIKYPLQKEIQNQLKNLKQNENSY